jgi:hypothetical protein
VGKSQKQRQWNEKVAYNGNLLVESFQLSKEVVEEEEIEEKEI